MFQFIGRAADQYRIPLLIGWITAAILVTALAPNLDDIATNDSSDFLPDDSPSIAGRALVEEHFPGQVQANTITLVFDAGDGSDITQQMPYIGEVSQWLLSEEAPEGIAGVQSPALNPEAASAFIAPDGQIGLVVIGVTATDDVTQQALLDGIEEKLDEAPANLKVYATGSTAIFADYNTAITETVDRTLIVTVVLVIILLLAIYRSPISPLIPLTVVTLAYLIARGIVAWLGQAEVFKVSGTASMLLIVVMYGVGTDYCLFLINRFRDELAQRGSPRQSVRFAVKNVSEVISSSAGTVMAGFLAMATAQLGLFNTTGPTLVIGVVVGLLAGLTLTPAMLGLLGQRAFWPGKARQRQTGALYRRTSQLVSTRPLLTIGVIVLIMSPFALYGSGQQASYDTLADLPEEIASVEGFRLMEEHLGAGNLQPLTIVTELGTENLTAEVEQVTQMLQAVDGVAVVRSASQPLGFPQEMNDTLAAMSAMYLNPETGAARFEVVLEDNPYSLDAMAATQRIRDQLNDVPGQDAVVGSTAIQTDLRDTLAEDMRRTITLVLVGIFIVLLLMLRSVVAPMYLIGTILLSYGTTLGITRLVSEVLWGTDQLTWWVPFFMFVFLVALGIDYSIFLFGRIKEEVSRHGIQEGIHHAVEATGSVITSAGIIVAGTFGAMMGGEILGLAQIGFAVSVGILIDTFVVRTILDPALATFFGRWTWWPGGVRIRLEHPGAALEATSAD